MLYNGFRDERISKIIIGNRDDIEKITVDNLKDQVKDYVDNILNTKDDINPLDYQKSQK